VELPRDAGATGHAPQRRSRIDLPGRKGSSAARQNGAPETAEKRAFPKVKPDHLFGQPPRSARMFRVGLYARASTNDQQTLQSRAMREYAAGRDWTIDQGRS
jgi:hypothetical protein